MFEVNVYGIMRMVQEFVHLLIAAEGTIVNIGSVAGVIPYAFGSAYNATKGAVHSYGDTLRVELKPFKYIKSDLLLVAWVLR
jgi:1-acylglycerone phosphate reductase